MDTIRFLYFCKLILFESIEEDRIVEQSMAYGLNWCLQEL